MVCVSFYVPGKTSAVALQPRRIAGGKLELMISGLSEAADGFGHSHPG